MVRRISYAAVLLLFSASFLFAAAPAPKDVDLTAADGTKLKATYYSAGKPGPAVLLLHMCNTDRKSWTPVAQQLAAVGINALTLDYRGFGESGGEPDDKITPEQRQKQRGMWPGDIDTAYSYLLSQPGVDKARVGAGGGSCGVDNAVQAARRHSEIKSLVLLAGPTNADGRRFLEKQAWIPVFTASAADDQFDPDALHSMQWLAELSGNARNKFVGFPNGKHGTEIFGPHPELPKEIVAWYVDTLVKKPANPNSPVKLKPTDVSEFWAAVDSPDGVAKAVEIYHRAKQRDPKAFLFPEQMLNIAGYEKLQAGNVKDAVALLQLNAEAYPDSANVYDSLGDAYIAAGNTEGALQATKKAQALLPSYNAPEQFKQALQQSIDQKLAKLQPSAK